jgi:hypothetical protein
MNLGNIIDILNSIFPNIKNLLFEGKSIPYDATQQSGMLTFQMDKNNDGNNYFRYLKEFRYELNDNKILFQRFVYKIVVEDEIDNTFIRIFWNNHGDINKINNEILYIFGNTNEIKEKIHENPIILNEYLE